MAKVSSATIKAVQITSRPKANGEYPIVIRVQYFGRAERYLPITCKKSEWDSKKGRVKSNCNSSNSHNRLITNELLKIEQKKLQFESNGIPYTAKDLLSDKNNLQNANSLIFKDLMNRMLEQKHYELHTARLYRYSYNTLCTFMCKNDFKVIELNSSNMEGFARYCKNVKGICDGTINTLLARIGVVFSYGVDCGIVDEVRYPYPFKKFKYWQTYKIGMNRFGLSKDVIEVLESDYVNQCVYTDGLQGIWWYKENVEHLLLNKRSSELFIQCLLLMCYHMQGIALCDLLRVRAENITIQKLEGEEYYIFSDLHRKKTGEGIDVISVKRTDTNAVIFDMFINSMDKRDGWFLPILYGKEESKYENQIQAMTQLINKKISKIFNRINSENNNVFNDMGVDVSKITYYTFRHTFATAFIEQGGNPFHLADLMGRSPNNIVTYINGLSNVEQLIKAKKILED